MMTKRKTPGADEAAPGGAGEAVSIRRRYTLFPSTVNSWHKVDVVAERAVDRLPRSTS